MTEKKIKFAITTFSTRHHLYEYPLSSGVGHDGMKVDGGVKVHGGVKAHDGEKVRGGVMVHGGVVLFHDDGNHHILHRQRLLLKQLRRESKTQIKI